jgi:DNA-binding MarR family transcriptional regulator
MTNIEKKKIVDYLRGTVTKNSMMILKYLLYEENISNTFTPLNQTAIAKKVGMPQAMAHRAFSDLVTDKVLIRGIKDKVYPYKLNEFLIRKVGVKL